MDLYSFLGGVGLLIRYLFAKTSAADCGDVVYIGPYVEIRNWKNLYLGSNVSNHRGCYLDAIGGITIGDDVSVAHSSSILSSDHSWDDLSLPIRDNPVQLNSVCIEDDVWVGCGVRILSGVTIKRRAVIAAGAVVIKDVSSATLVGGVPARILRNIEI